MAKRKASGEELPCAEKKMLVQTQTKMENELAFARNQQLLRKHVFTSISFDLWLQIGEFLSYVWWRALEHAIPSLHTRSTRKLKPWYHKPLKMFENTLQNLKIDANQFLTRLQCMNANLCGSFVLYCLDCNWGWKPNDIHFIKTIHQFQHLKTAVGEDASKFNEVQMANEEEISCARHAAASMLISQFESSERFINYSDEENEYATYCPGLRTVSVIATTQNESAENKKIDIIFNGSLIRADMTPLTYVELMYDFMFLKVLFHPQKGLSVLDWNSIWTKTCSLSLPQYLTAQATFDSFHLRNDTSNSPCADSKLRTNKLQTRILKYHNRGFQIQVLE